MLNSYEEFKKLVTAHEGAAKEYSQRSYVALNSIPPQYQIASDGVCRALSAAYIVRNRYQALAGFEEDNTGFTDLVFNMEDIKFSKAYDFKAPKESRSEADLNRFRTIARAQAVHALTGLLKKEDLIDAARKTVEELGNGILRYSMNTPLVVKKDESIPGETLPNCGYWLISTGAHMMAVAIRNTLKKGMKFKFFDPYYGQAIFKSREQFLKFLKDFLYEQQYNQVFFVKFI